MGKIKQFNFYRVPFFVALVCLYLPISMSAIDGIEETTKESRHEIDKNPPFDITLFSESDLKEILDFKDCSGIRFYKANDDDLRSPNGLMAVGITRDGSEIKGNSLIFFQGKNYFWKAPVGEPTLGNADRIKETNAKSMVEVFQNRNEIYLIVDISMDELNRILNQSGNVAGIKIVPEEVLVKEPGGDEKKYPTMGMIAVDKEFQEIGEMQIRTHPCPPMCPYDGKYLIPTQ